MKNIMEKNYYQKKHVTIKDGTGISETVDVVHDPVTGPDAVAIKQGKTVRILFQGSKQIFSDWVANDFVEGSDLLGLGIPVRSAYIPLFNRFKQSSSFLKKEMAKYPDCKFEVYGHSLGAMDGQYAVSSLDDDEAKRLSGAWVYEGPNIYENLTDAQRKRAKSYQGRVHNYVDQKDLVPFGYPDKKVMAYSSDQAIDPDMGNTVYVYEDSPYVGSLYRIDSKKAKGNNLLSQKNQPAHVGWIFLYQRWNACPSTEIYFTK